MGNPSIIIPDYQCFSEYSYALAYFLNQWGCPSYLRPLITHIAIISQGDPKAISDAEFSMLTGWSRHSMTMRRQRLREFQAENNCSFVEVKEHKFDYRIKKHKPTEYTFLCADLLNNIIRRARESVVYQGDWKRAIRTAVGELLRETGTAPIYRKRPARRERSHRDVAKTLFKLFQTIASKNLEHTRRGGEHPSFLVPILKREIETQYDEMILKEPTKGKRE